MTAVGSGLLLNTTFKSDIFSLDLEDEWDLDQDELPPTAGYSFKTSLVNVEINPTDRKQ